MKAKLKKTDNRNALFIKKICILVLSLIWLFPVQKYELLSAFFVCAASIGTVTFAFIIKNPLISFFVALAVNIFLGIFNSRYLICFAPIVFSALLYYYAITDQKSKPIKYDGLFFVMCIVHLGFSMVAVFFDVSNFGNHLYDGFVFYRQYVYLLFLISIIVLLLIETYRKGNSYKDTPAKVQKMRWAYSSFFFSVLGILLYVPTSDSEMAIISYPLFFFAALLVFVEDPYLRRILDRFSHHIDNCSKKKNA